MFTDRVTKEAVTSVKNKPCIGVLCAAAACAHFLAPATIAEVSFDWMIIGNPGNPADIYDGDRFTPGTQRFGSVDYEYRVASTEVTNAQYAEFLNSVARSDPHGLYNSNMGTDEHSGITRSGSPGSYDYSVVAGRGDDPVVYVSFFDAVRFTNWLHNGQGRAGTESGAYDIDQGMIAPRDSDALFFIPNADEWYKAAYHQPAADGGDDDGFWLYPTSGNVAPLGGVDANLNMTIADTSSVGAFGGNYYGLSDMAGNVWEWTEAKVSSSIREIRGGSWGMSVSYALPDGWLFKSQTGENNSVGFRIASALPIPTCSGDIDGSGLVDTNDLNLVLAAWEMPIEAGSPLDLANDDGVLDIDDLMVLLSNFGVACD